MGTTEKEMVPGDALKSLSQYYLSIPGCMVWREREEGRRVKQKETEIDGEEERRFEPLPHQQSPPDRAGTVN